MCNRIRAATGNSAKGQLFGEVEVDETFAGGKAKNRHVDERGRPGRGSLGSGKKPFVGAVSRQGKVVARVVDSVDGKSLKGFVREVVSTKVSLLVTDESVGYHGLGRDYPNGVIRHTPNQYVVGAVHTDH